MKKLKFNHAFTGVTGGLNIRGCRIVGDSLTVPEMNYTIREILEKFTRLPDIMNNSLVYDEEPDFNDPVVTDFKDLSDIHEKQLEFNWYKDVLSKKKTEDKKEAPEVTPGEKTEEN